MNGIDKQALYSHLVETYRNNHPRSYELFQRAGRSLIKGGSHSIRLMDPFPVYDVRSEGARVTDADGHSIIDFWQGHFANVLGHNPPIVLDGLRDYFAGGQGLLTGFPGMLQMELAEILLSRVKAERVRFTTSGTLATMYAVMLARAYTGRSFVIKIGGGWHGAQPYLLKGISHFREGLDELESAGLPRHIDASILMTRFNDMEDLKSRFKKHGKKVACLILEPFVGAGGFLFAAPDYLRLARELTEKYGSLLIFDEVISGFRFSAGGVQKFYGVSPDLSVFGKTIGGGMPVSAVTGREDILKLCRPDAPEASRVKFEGGTFSAHPAAMLAGKLYLKYLIDNEDTVYSTIGSLGDRARTEIENILRSHGFFVRCSGKDPSVVPSSSCVGVHFLNEDAEKVRSPEQVWNSRLADFEMREKLFKMAMLNEGFHVFHGYGAVSLAHSEVDIQASLDAVDRIGRLFSSFRK
ncbi:MAG: aminotransferase class III-fold pyridoxal phosphate-dependent enzyme [Acidobacteria bacterium]|nr:aminotransferase class III-fold pyridoxal phosphate-dependent enzyme [Acidobacteriota bacterium]MBU4255151.1 aminotransferase class III-fold pyridoxal phosphate-dependent enzyme [Acidobacteriota bacterium]MBU4330827.1 aminotransferase class III-fold pyridoxal phosphate-dependent enzyme [Acidobacteriota bacterium]